MPMVGRHFMKVPVQAIRKSSDTCSKPEQTSMPRQMVVVGVQSWWLAKQSLGEDHELISYLESLGALDDRPDL
jgi:hypothetical protein